MDALDEMTQQQTPPLEDEFGSEVPIDLDAAKEQEREVPVRLPFAFAKKFRVLLTRIDGDFAEVSYCEDTTVQAISEVRRGISKKLRLTKIPSEEFEALMQKLYEQGENKMAMMEDLGDEMDLSSVADALPEPADLLESDDDAPIIRLINAILTEAIKEGASDIHIEPFEHRLIVRFRVDGVLREVLQPQRVMAPLIVSRIKVMAALDISEKRLPQDGRIALRIAGRAVDVRVSTLPSGHGERIVLRLLDKQAGKLDLEQLGMPSEIKDLVDGVIHKPHGIFLVTGPTGSGKSTTLYAGLTRLNTSSRSILTVEDPIEYDVEGIGQTQVNTKVGLSFAKGLRAILRQDPDVVMIGEVRDLETAQIAVQASLTGHLVMSSLHTNTAIGAVTRLRDMGIEPFLVASSLLGVLAQRLVRLLCPNCKEAYQASNQDCEDLGIHSTSPATLYRPVGCSECNNTGYRGRGGVYELVLIDEEMRTMIHRCAPEHELDSYARTQTLSLRREASRRVLAGDTSLEEVLRVTKED